MSLRGRVDPDVLAAVRGLVIDEDYLRFVVEQLTGIGSSPLGFRTTGTPEDARVAAFVADQMRAVGLTGVAVEGVQVDGWRFRSAEVALCGAPDRRTLTAVSFGGVPGTGPQGVTGRLVDVGDARRRRLDRVDLAGAVALLDWRSDAASPSAVVLELAERGVVGLVVTVPARGPWYQSPGALGGFDSHWPAGAPPMVLVAREDAAALRAFARADRSAQVALVLDAELTPSAVGSNVVGHLPGDLPGPVVAGAHHDAWFRGAFDNTSGVASLLAIARALVAADLRPRHTLCFTSRTAEEYGIAGSGYDWCIGAWRQVTDSHPEWSGSAPFHLCMEASGRPGLRSVIEAPVELAGWAGQVGRVAQREGWTPTGWRVAPPVSGTEQWPLLVAGVPGVACYAWERSFGRTDYHTQFDTVDRLDFGVLAAQTRLSALLLLDADHDPDRILDHDARARQLAAVAEAAGHDGLWNAAQRHRYARGRQDFTSVGKAFFALDAHGRVCLPHEQAAADVRALTAALAALDRGDRSGAARELRAVGQHHLVDHLGERAFRAHTERDRPAAVRRSWASASHLTVSDDLWSVIATLRGESGARPDGPWLRADLEKARTRAHHLLTERLDAMARSVPTRHAHTTRSR